MHIGEIFKIKREEKGLTIEELAEYIDKSKSTIALMERYGVMPNFDTACKLCELLDIDIKWLWEQIKEDYEKKVNTKKELIDKKKEEA